MHSTYVARLHWVITLHQAPGKAALQFRVAPPAAPSSQAVAADGSTQASQEPQEALFVATLSLLQSLLQLLDHRLEVRGSVTGSRHPGFTHTLCRQLFSQKCTFGQDIVSQVGGVWAQGCRG